MAPEFRRIVCRKGLTAKQKRCFTSGMSEISAVEEGLERVIGVDGEPDRRLDGLDEDALLSIHRSLVLLRTYDERSVVYHRQGRIGTYAIFRHEAIQAGAVHALEERDWIFRATATRRSACSAVCLPRRSSSGGAATLRLVEPQEVNVASICVPIATQVLHAAGLAWGMRLRGSDAVAVTLFGDGATSEGAFHEGANIAAVEGAARPALRQQPVGDLHPAQRPDRRRAAGRQGDRLRHARAPCRRARRSGRLRGDEGERRRRAPGRGRPSWKRSPTARPRTPPPTT